MNQRPTFIEAGRRAVLSTPFAFALAVMFGAGAMVESWLPAALLVGVIVAYASVSRPTIPIALAFLGILLDSRGMTSLRIFGLPLTLSKTMVLFAVGSHLLNALVSRKRLFSVTPMTTGFFAIICTMVMSLITAIMPSWGYMDTIGVLMLALMVHLIYEAIPDEDIPWLLRLMSAMTVGVLLWTLATQRKEGFYVTLDHAWQQRTSGAYDDPNAWSTALLVVCPMLIGALARDKHWSATFLLLGVLFTFPAAILQSMSRAGLLAMVVISPGIVYLLRDRRWLLATAGVGLLAAAPLFINLDALSLRYSTLLNPTLEADLGHGSLSERRALLEAGVKIFLENPVLGVGTGLFRIHASYVSAGQVWKIAHNSYINVAAEQGIPGILSHLFLGYQLYVAAWNAANRSRTPYTLSLGQGFLLSILAFSAMAFTLNLVTFAIAYFMLGLGLRVARAGGAEQVWVRDGSDPVATPERRPRPKLVEAK
ncbi:MAG: O-antigen ligase family protein [Myxococcota bacterium]